jgi:hypothetical protein
MGVRPWAGDSPSDEICPSCGIHFGYDDATPDAGAGRRAVYDGWRARWMGNGMLWWSTGGPPPSDWDPLDQLRRIGVKQHRRGKAVSALVPGAGEIAYRGDLRSLIRGRFRCKITFSHFEPGDGDNPDDAAGVPSPIKPVWPSTLADAIALEPPPTSRGSDHLPGTPHRS